VTAAFPNQVRNQYRGPGFFDSDFAINKNFKITERVTFGAGASFYNVFNHPNFGQPNKPAGNDYVWASHVADRPTDDSLRIVLRRLACWPHRSADRKDRLLDSFHVVHFGGPSGPPFFLLQPRV